MQYIDIIEMYNIDIIEIYNIDTIEMYNTDIIDTVAFNARTCRGEVIVYMLDTVIKGQWALLIVSNVVIDISKDCQ